MEKLTDVAPVPNQPADRRYLFEELSAEAAWVGRCWIAYQQMYSRHDRVKALLESAPYLFAMMQRLMQEGIVLGIQRLLDPGVSRGSESASIERLLRMRSSDRNPERDSVVRRLRKELNEVRTQAAAITAWRHRRVAHSDYPTVMGTHPDRLVNPRVSDVDAAVKKIEAILNDFGQQYYGDAVSVDVGDVDADTMIFLLEEGRRQHPPITFPSAAPPTSTP